MKIRRNLTAAALIVALHAGLLVVLYALSPSAMRVAPLAGPPLPSTVVVVLAPLPTPAPVHAKSQSALSPRASFAPRAFESAAPPRSATTVETAIAQPTAPEVAEGLPATTDALKIGTQALQSAAQAADKNSVRRLALQSGKLDMLETEKPHPVALAAAESSEPSCPRAIHMRESAGPQGYRLTPDRSGDCERDRAARVRARALGR